MLLLTESLITFKGEFVIFAARFKDDSLLLKEILLSHNGEFVSIKGWKNNGGNVVFNGWIVIEPTLSDWNVVIFCFDPLRNCKLFVLLDSVPGDN